MESELTWQKAKEKTQKMELEIAALIPKDVVVKTDQMKTGSLFSCSKTQYNWLGATTVTVKPGTDIDKIVRDIQTHYENSRFKLDLYEDSPNKYKLQLSSRDTAEDYIIGPGFTPDAFRIASASACFTLPEGVYPGGDF